LNFGVKVLDIRNCSLAASRSSTIFWGEGVGIGEIVGFFEAFISEPEDVEAGLIRVGGLNTLKKSQPPDLSASR